MSLSAPPWHTRCQLTQHVKPTSLALLIVAISMLPMAAQAYPVIQEVYYDQPGGDGSSVFTELYGPAGLNLDDWNLLGINGANGAVYADIDLTGSVIPEDGLLLIVTVLANPELMLLSDLVAEVNWQNGPDAVQLIDHQGAIIDALQYGDRSGFERGEGYSAPDVNAGSSLSRRSIGLDSNDNRTDFEILTTPTPGSAPAFIVATPLAAEPIPVPDTHYLMLLALPLLHRIRRLREQRSEYVCGTG